MKIKFLIKEANRYKKETGLSYKSTKIIKLAADIADIIQSGGKVFMRFTNRPRFELNYEFKFPNPHGIYAYNFPPHITKTEDVIEMLEDIHSGDKKKVEKIMGHDFALDKKYLMFFTYPSKNLWTLTMDEEENEWGEDEYKDNLTEEQYIKLLEKIYVLCEERIKAWADFEGWRPEDAKIFYERMIESILDIERQYSYPIRKTRDYKIYKITYWIAQNWDEKKFYSDDNTPANNYGRKRNKNAFVWGILLRKLGISGISDLGTNTVGGFGGVGYSQAFLLHPEKCQMIGVIDWNKISHKEAEPTSDKLFNQEKTKEREKMRQANKTIDAYLFDDYEHSLLPSIKIKILENMIENPSENDIVKRYTLVELLERFDFVQDSQFILENIDLITKFFNVFLTSQTNREEFFENISRYVRHPDNTGKFYAILPYVYYNKHINKSLFAEYLKKINFNVRTDRDKLLLYQQIALNCVGSGEGALELAKKAAQSNKIRVGASNMPQLKSLKQFLIKIINYRF